MPEIFSIARERQIQDIKACSERHLALRKRSSSPRDMLDADRDRRPENREDPTHHNAIPYSLPAETTQAPGALADLFAFFRSRGVCASLP